jgi:hypothetical protein
MKFENTFAEEYYAVMYDVLNFKHIFSLNFVIRIKTFYKIFQSSKNKFMITDKLKEYIPSRMRIYKYKYLYYNNLYLYKYKY